VAVKSPISAVVVCFNEEKLLGKCLASLQFCDEIVVIDLGSTDNSVEVASKLGAKVINHPWVPIGEMARPKALENTRHKWVLFIDPDEAVSPKLSSDIREVRNRNPNDVGVISVPWLNHVHGRVLRGTVWGGFERRKRLLMHRDRVKLNTLVHSDYFDLKPKYKVFDIPAKKNNFLIHYWLNDYRVFIAKHRRYLKLEPEARLAPGELASYRGVLLAPWRNFKESFLTKKGYKDGLRGFFLSLLWAWYNTDALIRLKREQIRRGVRG